jgi:hypothetical protein
MMMHHQPVHGYEEPEEPDRTRIVRSTETSSRRRILRAEGDDPDRYKFTKRAAAAMRSFLS